MNIDEVHATIKRALSTTIKISEATIEYYEQRIKELKEVVRTSQRASADEVLPKNQKEGDMHGTLAAITNALENEPTIEPLSRKAVAGTMPSSLNNRS
jgi:hypothetical protein